MNQDIEQAVQLLKSGELVAFPTETVYGLGADAKNPEAIKKIFEVKGRPSNHPIILHIYNESELEEWVVSIPDIARKLMKHFWPGALTLIFEAKENVSPLITGNQKTIGIRMPSHPVARELLKAFGSGLVAPSANKFGKVSPTKAKHVKEELGDEIKLILEGGDCALGIESTIIDVTRIPPRLLRPGPLDVDQVKKISGVTIIYSNKNIPRVSGSLPSHYAPKTPVKLFDYNKIKFQDKNIGVMSFRDQPENFTNIIWLKMPINPTLYAKQLYANLRKLDKNNLDTIWVEVPPKEVVWGAILDRLKRASK
jgi:L-threonylcarbamoyladenylate synthase